MNIRKMAGMAGAAVLLAVALSPTLGAVTVPDLQSGVGAFSSSNYEVGTSYGASLDGTYLKVGGLWVGQGGAAGGAVTVTAPGGVVGGEEGYGLFWIKALMPGTFGTNSVTPGGDPYWQQPLGSAAGTRLMGYFWGGEDIKLVFTTTGTTQRFTASQTDSMKFRMFAVDLSAGVGGAQGVANQIRQSDSHQGNPPVATSDFITSGSGAGNWPGNTITSTLLFSGTAESLQFVESGVSGTQALGHSTVFLSVDPTQGVWGSVFDTNRFLSDAATSADIRIDWVIEGPVTYGTTDLGSGMIRSSDEGGFAIVPEPATLSLLALSGLAMIRRRRK